MHTKSDETLASQVRIIREESLNEKQDGDQRDEGE